MKRLFALLVLLCIFNPAAQAQLDSNSEYYKLIVKNDSLLFERSFNNCELEVLELLMSDDLEFYHDVGGITFTKKAFIENFKNGICGNPKFKSRRELVTGSIKVYALKNKNEVYGLIQQGEHRFFETFDGAPEVAGNIAKFTHLWILEGDTFKLKRALSYDHKMPDFLEDKSTVTLSSKELKLYIGSYQAPNTGSVEVKIEQQQLIMVAGKDQIPLTPISKTRFGVPYAPLEFDFTLSDGKVTGFKVFENNNLVEQANKVQRERD